MNFQTSMGSKSYEALRDFKNTPEPTGKKKISRKRKIIFVIQKHHATRLHFDFRLESSGVLKSWAVPKGIPAAGEKHLAMMVEDHPYEYRNFEGIIPPGNYGAGTVIVWDSGTYHLKDGGSDLEKEIERGEIKIILEGSKVSGEFALVKTGFGKGNGWLMIAKKNSSVKNDDSSIISGKNLNEVKSEILDKKSPGIRKSSQVEFVSPMKAHVAGQPFDDEKWLFEIKWDGYRIIASKKSHEVRIFSRNEKNYTELFFSIAEGLKNINHDFILDGEVVAVDSEGKSSFQLLQDYFLNKNSTLIYYVFDIIYLDGFDLKSMVIEDRKAVVKKIITQASPFIKESEFIVKEGQKLFSIATENNLEGIVAKKLGSKYYPGIRSYDWLKIKAENRQEAIICGFTEPRGSRQKFGALVLGMYRNDVLEYIGHVGGGFDGKMLNELHRKLDRLIVKENPFKKKIATNMPVTWVEPSLVCEIKFSQWTKDGLMRQPIFLGLREDKDYRDVKFEEGIDKYDIGEVVEQREVEGKKIKLTNPEKILWPDEGYTKKDLIEYYFKISEFILPFIKGRPQSLNRFPNGIEEKNFFQKDIKEGPSWLKTIKIYSESENKNISYLLCDDKATLVYMANLACIELNVWNSTVENLEHPDYMVFDIDPEEGNFKDAILVAKETKKILDKLKLKSFCKTSGGRGLHIYVPLKTDFSYDQVKEFCRAVNLLVNSHLPEITTLERIPNQRSGKVYLDYLQNRKGQTMAAPYSLRPRAGATVSTPLDWREVNDRLDPKKFDIKSIFGRIAKKGEVWKDFAASGCDIFKALELLEIIMKNEKKL